MIKCVIVFLFSVGLLNAQDNVGQAGIDVKVGNAFEIGKSETNKYGHIDFPKANFIIKRGGMENYRPIQGEKVVVTSGSERKDGSTKVKIKRTDGGKFFGSHSMVAASFDDALKTAELQIL